MDSNKIKSRIIKELESLTIQWDDESYLGDWSSGYKKGVVAALDMVLSWIKEEENNGRP